jgi:hypothetical protein
MPQPLNAIPQPQGVFSHLNSNDFFKLTMNMCLRLCSEGEGIVNIAKCRINLGVTLFLPPPGGAHAAANVTS